MRRHHLAPIRWKIQFDAGLMPDITIAVRMEAGENIKPLDMVKDLEQDQRRIVLTIKKALAAAHAAGDEATADMLIGRLEVHDKNAWMLEATGAV